MSVSTKIVIDLTENLSKVGDPLPFTAEFSLDDDLLQYPNSTLQKVIVDFDVTFDNPDVFVEGEITCFVNGFCDKCLCQVSKQIVLPFEQTFFKDSGEEDEYVYFDSKLDVTKAVCDEIVLSMPMQFLCKDDCKGLCPKCGVDLNKHQCDCDTSRDNPFAVLKNIKF